MTWHKKTAEICHNLLRIVFSLLDSLHKIYPCESVLFGDLTNLKTAMFVILLP